MLECQFRVFCCFWFQKSYTENILRIIRNLFLHKIKDREASGVRRSPGGEPPGAHTLVGRGPWWGRAQVGCGGPGWPPTPILRLYNPLDAKTLTQERRYSTKSSIAAIIVNLRSGEFGRSSRHPAGGEIITGGFYIIMPASGVMRE